MIKRMLFVSLPEHTKTGSAIFFTELLEKAYQVTIRNSKDFNDLSDNEYDRIVFWQRLPSQRYLNNIPASNIIYIPMYDEARNYNRQIIRTWAPFKIISFCRSMHEDLTSWGFNSKYVQYFPNPMVEAPLPVDTPKAFFWRRESSYINEAIPDVVINTLLRGTGMKLHYHSEISGSSGGHACADMVASQSSWMANKEELMTLMRECSLYIAPRESEGIGMSFLDAMANGLAVVGANNPTMNEYITHGVNGYLFDLMHPKKLDLCDLQRVRERSLETCSVGYEKWERDKWSLIDFIEAPYQTSARVQVPRSFEYRSLKQKDVRFTIKRIVKKLVGK